MGKRPRTVLVVDDEFLILKLVQSILKPWKLNVRIAPRPAEALQICEREPVHLLISDLRMPGMEGLKLAERVLQIHPGAAVLLISGASKNEPRIALNGRVRFLRKPFFPAVLIKALRELLPEMG